MYSVTFKGFKSMEHAEAFAAWYDCHGEQNSDDWLEVFEQPSAYVERPHIIEESGITLNIKPQEEF